MVIKHYETVNTTPESYEIQKHLREMVDNGVKYLCYGGIFSSFKGW